MKAGTVAYRADTDQPGNPVVVLTRSMWNEHTGTAVVAPLLSRASYNGSVDTEVHGGRLITLALNYAVPLAALTPSGETIEPGSLEECHRLLKGAFNSDH